ncbi:MAG: phosphatase PAP2 family protein [Bacteroidales bacterium]|jgi:undecaprenyl-diphosphatase|nr:phosphatase PAP2 family protein [Bacteroidales bacterium]
MNGSIDKLLPLERDFFLALNGSDSLFWDNAMWTFTGLVTWLPMVLFILYIAFRNQQLKQGMLVLGSILLVLLLSSYVSGSIFKPFFKRYRPTHHPDFKDLVDIVNNFRGGDYGFISGHATNSFGLAFFISLLFRNQLVTISMMLWATLNSYSRIYLGVHFISDIVAGFLMGALIGLLVYKLYKKVQHRSYDALCSEKNNSIYTQKQGNILGLTIILYIALVIIFSPFLTSFSHSIIPASWF